MARSQSESADPKHEGRAGELDDLSGKVLALLIGEASRLIGRAAEDFDEQAELIDLGFDSIELELLTAKLNERFGLRLTPTIYFLHPTLGGLAAHLVAEHREAFV